MLSILAKYGPPRQALLLMPARPNSQRPIAPSRYFQVLMPATAGTTSGAATSAATRIPPARFRIRIWFQAAGYTIRGGGHRMRREPNPALGGRRAERREY